MRMRHDHASLIIGAPAHSLNVYHSPVLIMEVTSETFPFVSIWFGNNQPTGESSACATGLLHSRYCCFTVVFILLLGVQHGEMHFSTQRLALDTFKAPVLWPPATMNRIIYSLFFGFRLDSRLNRTLQLHWHIVLMTDLLRKRVHPNRNMHPMLSAPD